jgi:membrane associated rhomboid family serine protease
VRGARDGFDWLYSLAAKSYGMGDNVKSIFKILAGLLLMGSVYGFFMLLQSPESGFDKNIPIAMAVGGLVFGILSTGGKSKFDPADKKWSLLKGLTGLLLLGFLAYYFFKS